MVGLDEDRLDRFPHELSGGQRQRIMIALALTLDPQLVIMDEPTTALDVVTQREIISELFELRAKFGFAMIFITHDLSLLTELADEIVVMYAGALVERATSRELYEAPRHPVLPRSLELLPPDARRTHGTHRVSPAPPRTSRTCRPGCSFHPRCPYAMAAVHERDAAARRDQGYRSVGRVLAARRRPGVAVPRRIAVACRSSEAP